MPRDFVSVLAHLLECAAYADIPPPFLDGGWIKCGLRRSPSGEEVHFHYTRMNGRKWEWRTASFLRGAAGTTPKEQLAAAAEMIFNDMGFTEEASAAPTSAPRQEGKTRFAVVRGTCVRILDGFGYFIGFATEERAENACARINAFVEGERARAVANIRATLDAERAAYAELADRIRAIETCAAQDALEDPVGFVERDREGFVRLGKGVVDNAVRVLRDHDARRAAEQGKTR